MTFEIIKPIAPVEKDSFDSVIDRETMISGLAADTIKNVRDAVFEVNKASGKSLSIGDIRGAFKALVKELGEINSKADELAGEGKTITEIVKAIEGGSFDAEQIKAMKIEVYGSIVAWKAEMQSVGEV